MINRVLTQAKQYINLGWGVLPLHKPFNQQCSCGKKDCNSIGKHPSSKHGFKDATLDSDTCNSWFSDGNRNIGIKTGKETGLLVLDIDPRNGGDRTLDALEEQHGRLPDTLVADTGGGGLHYFFKYPKNKSIKSKSNVYTGIDVKANRGYVVAEPSMHASGQPYAFRDVEEVSLDQLKVAPEWLLDAIESDENHPQKQDNVDNLSSHICKGGRHMHLLSIGGKLRKIGLEKEQLQAALLKENELKCSPSLETVEVLSIVKSLAKYSSKGLESIKPKLDEKALSGPIGSIIKKLEGRTEAHPAALLTQFLTAFGSALGVKPYFLVGADEHKCNQFTCIVGNTSKGRKGLSWGVVKKLMSAIDFEWLENRIQNGLSSSEGLINKLSYQIEKEKDSRMLVVEPEFASVLRQAERNGNTLSAILRLAWDGDRLQTMTVSSPLHAEGHHLSIISHITKVELDKLLSEADKYNGLANRFLWIYSERTILIPNPDTIDPKDFEREISSLIKATKLFEKPTEIKLSPEAQELWNSIYFELSHEGNPLVDAITSRAEPYVLRLAMLCAIQECSLIIEIEHLESAYALWNYAQDSANYIFGGSVLNKKEQKLLGAIKNNQDGYSRTQAFKLFNNHVSASVLDKLLEKLEDMNLIYSKSSEDDDSKNLYYAN